MISDVSLFIVFVRDRDPDCWLLMSDIEIMAILLLFRLDSDSSLSIVFDLEILLRGSEKWLSLEKLLSRVKSCEGPVPR